ncbi:MAG: sporulation protein YqfD [Clostridia bacterium]|nr:sporulation protein YqfD [Clostridia bacterium]
MKGIVRSFTVEGLNLERFIALSAEAGIRFTKLKRQGRRLWALTGEDELASIEEIASKGGWRFCAGNRQGSGRGLDAMKRHWPLWAGGLLLFAVIFTATQLVWNIDIIEAGIYQADLEGFLTENDIRLFRWKSRIDLDELRDSIEWRYPDIAWADCGWRGTTLRITLVEGTPQGETFSKIGSGDVVAARGGIVESIVTVAGTPVVAPGDVIQPGQVLIQGIERSADETTIPVMARGIVNARVWDQAAVQMPMTETATTYTGNRQETWTVCCPWFDLWTMREPGYAHQDIRRKQVPLGGLFLPFTWVLEEHMEAEVVQKQRDAEAVQAEAGAAALRLLREKTEFDDELVDKWVDYCMIEGEVLEAIAYGERIVDVAQPRRNAE